MESDKQAAPVSAGENYASLADEPVGEPRPPQPRETPESPCCGSRMRDDTAFYTCPCGNQYEAGDTFGFPLKLVGCLQPMRVSAGEVKRGENLADDVAEAFRLANQVPALQSRIATLEAELLLVTKEKMAAERDKNRAESELAAFKDSLPERAEKAAGEAALRVREWAGESWPECEDNFAEIFLAEMQRKKGTK